MLFLDACALIYRFEGAVTFRTAAMELMAQLSAEQTSVELAVSRLSVLECRVKPLCEGNAALLNLNPAVGRGRGADEAGLWLGASAPRTACPGGASNNARGLRRQTCGRAAPHP